MLGFRSHNVCEDSKAGKRRNKGAKRLSFTTRCVFVPLNLLTLVGAQQHRCTQLQEHLEL